MSEEEKNKIAIDLAKQGIDLEDVEKICIIHQKMENLQRKEWQNMIHIKRGNILNCTENIICHQVNVQGVMGRRFSKTTC